MGLIEVSLETLEVRRNPAQEDSIILLWTQPGCVSWERDPALLEGPSEHRPAHITNVQSAC